MASVETPFPLYFVLSKKNGVLDNFPEKCCALIVFGLFVYNFRSGLTLLEKAHIDLFNYVFKQS